MLLNFAKSFVLDIYSIGLVYIIELWKSFLVGLYMIKFFLYNLFKSWIYCYIINISLVFEIYNITDS